MSNDMMSEINNFFCSNSDNDVIRVGSKDALGKFLSKLSSNYNLDELQGILDCEDNMLIISGAGSGKTTSLILKILCDILSGKLLKEVTVNGKTYLNIRSILVSTFLKTGALELATKFDTICKEYNIVGVHSSQISFKTIHSEVYSALSSMGVVIKIIDGKDANTLLKEACKICKIKHVSSKSGSLVLTNEESNDVASILAYSRNRLDGGKDMHPLMGEYGMGSYELKMLTQVYSQLKQLAKKQDFEDLEEQLYEAYSKYPKVLDFIKSRYEYIYVDEFQDTSQLQYAILRPYFDSSKGFLCIGDDDQCIYSWRGSDVTLIQKKFSEDYRPVIKQLTINRRCASNILNAVIPSIEKNTSRMDKKLKSDNLGGEVKIIIDGGVNYLMDAIKVDLSKSERIGILGRTNADLLIPAILLQIDGYSAFSISKSISLSDRIPSQVLGIINLITKRYTGDFLGYFKLFLGKYESYQASKLCDILSTTDYSIYSLPLDDIKYSVPALFPLIRMLRKEVEEDPVKAYISLLEIMEQDVYNGKTIYAQRARDFTYYIRKIIKEHESLKGKNIEDLSYLFLQELPKALELKKTQSTQQNIDDKTGKQSYTLVEDKAYVKITTVHDAKGKEWDNVYIWNDVDGCFPNSVGNRVLTAEEYEEERRVHYIAWTRPRKKLTVFTRSDREPGFLSECNLENVEKVKLGGRDLKIPIALVKNKSNGLNVNTCVGVDLSDFLKDALKAYVIKYTSYNNICTVAGSNLDICLTKLNGFDGVLAYLNGFELESCPNDCLDSMISDVLEAYVLNLG